MPMRKNAVATILGFSVLAWALVIAIGVFLWMMLT